MTDANLFNEQRLLVVKNVWRILGPNFVCEVMVYVLLNFKRYAKEYKINHFFYKKFNHL